MIATGRRIGCANAVIAVGAGLVAVMCAAELNVQLAKDSPSSDVVMLVKSGLALGLLSALASVAAIVVEARGYGRRARKVAVALGAAAAAGWLALDIWSMTLTPFEWFKLNFFAFMLTPVILHGLMTWALWRAPAASAVPEP